MPERRDGDRADGPLTAALLGFVERLRATGVDVPADGGLAAAEALVALDSHETAMVRTALRASLVTNPADYERFDRLFEEFWPPAGGGMEVAESATGLAGAAAGSADQDADPDPETTHDNREEGGRSHRQAHASGLEEAETEETAGAPVYSRSGQSHALAVSMDSQADTRTFQRSFERFSAALATRAGRRTVRGSARVDSRRLLRESLSTGGVPLPLPEEEPDETAVEGVLLVDVSRSVLDAIDTGFLIRFLRAAHTEWRHARTFLFDTDVLEVSKELAAPTPAAAVRALEAADLKWGGGTRIGDAIATVRERAHRSIDRNTVVVVVSDGLEVGDIETLRRGMAWLARRSATLVWLNPLAGLDGYEATCRGMAAALPYVDAFFPFAGPADVTCAAVGLERNDDGQRYA